MITENEKQIWQELLKLMTENPDLPILCLGTIDATMFEEDRAYWCPGCIKKASIEKFYPGEETFYFEDDEDDAVIEWAGKTMAEDMEYVWGEFEELSPEKKEKAYNTIPWKTVILVEIEFE